MNNKFKLLGREFYERDPLEVAKDLLGRYVVRETDDGSIIGKIVEVEAYIGPDDKASHAHNNKVTKRTKVQYRERGLAYIFSIYGRNNCFCVVVGKERQPAVVLVRAVEPVKGLELMKKNRNNVNIKNLTNGPSKFCKAFGITKEFYGFDLCEGRSLYIARGEPVNTKEISKSKRINIDYASEWKDVEWRFYIKGNGFVSR